MQRFVTFGLVAALAFTGYGLSIPSSEAKEMSRHIPTVSPGKHQPIKASVVDNTPKHFTIDVKKFANLSVNEEAPTFAVYVTNRLPDRCGDFRSLAIPYVKPNKYTRTFNLSRHPDVLDAIDKYGCVVMKNIPPTAQDG